MAQARAPEAGGRAPRAAVRGLLFVCLASIGRGTLAAVQFLYSALWITASRPRLTRLCDFCPGDALLWITLWILDRPVGIVDHVQQLPKLADPVRVFCTSKLNIQETYTRPVVTKLRSAVRGSRATLGVNYCEKIEPRDAVHGSRYV